MHSGIALRSRLPARVAPGASLAIVVALAATFLSSAHGGPQLLYALFMGVAFNYLSTEPTTQPGVEFCSRFVLRLGVGLLGARITVDQIQGLGWGIALSVIAGVATTFFLGVFASRLFGLSRAQGVVCGGAVAICGASAALAISAVLPTHAKNERFTLLVVVTVTILSTVAMIVYPLIAGWLSLSPLSAGLFLGGSIHDVAQVAGAAYTLGADTGDVATIVKLFRVAMLSIVVIGISTAYRIGQLRAEGSDRPATPRGLVPWFLWLFALMVALNSAGVIPMPIRHAFDETSRACLVVAIAALGMKTSIKELARAGWSAMGLIVAETLWLALLMICLAMWLR